LIRFDLIRFDLIRGEDLEMFYRWSQNEETITIASAIPDGIEETVEVVIEPDYISAKLPSQKHPIVQGKLYAKIDHKDSYWTIENETQYKVRILTIHLEKSRPISDWPHLMKLDSPDLDPTSLYQIGLAFEQKGNYEQALQNYNTSAENGSVDAQMKLAAIYALKESKFSVPQNLEESFRYHLLAAEQNNAQGAFFVANSYQYGHGVDINFVKAVEWYEKSLHSTQEPAYLSIAFLNLGVLYKEGGHGLEPNMGHAIKWWSLGDRIGAAACTYNLAVICFQGWGQERNIGMAVALFKKAKAIDNSLEIPEGIQLLILEEEREKQKEEKLARERIQAKSREEINRKRPKDKKKGKGKKNDDEDDEQEDDGDDEGEIEQLKGKAKGKGKGKEKEAKKEKKKSGQNGGSSTLVEAIGFGMLLVLVISAFILSKPKR